MTNNSISSPDPLGRPRAQIVFEVFAAALICIASVAGNALVVHVIRRDPRLHSVNNMFVMNLAWSDIFMALGEMPFWIVSLLKGRWVFGRRACYVAVLLQLTFGTASLHTLALIALNRYYKVVKSKSNVGIFADRTKVKFLIALAWITPALFSSPPLYGWGDVAYYDKAHLCSIDWDTKHISYIVVLLGISVNSATVVIFYCYYKIYRAVKRAAKSVDAHATLEIPQSNQSRANRKAENTLLRTTFIVVCAYLICWMPVSVVGLSEMAKVVIPRWIDASVIYLMFVSSCVNPIIYGLQNPQFRRAYSQVLRCCRRDRVNRTELLSTRATAGDHPPNRTNSRWTVGTLAST